MIRRTVRAGTFSGRGSRGRTPEKIKKGIRKRVSGEGAKGPGAKKAGSRRGSGEPERGEAGPDRRRRASGERQESSRPDPADEAVRLEEKVSPGVDAPEDAPERVPLRGRVAAGIQDLPGFPHTMKTGSRH